MHPRQPSQSLPRDRYQAVASSMVRRAQHTLWLDATKTEMTASEMLPAITPAVLRPAPIAPRLQGLCRPSQTAPPCRKDGPHAADHHQRCRDHGARSHAHRGGYPEDTRNFVKNYNSTVRNARHALPGNRLSRCPDSATTQGSVRGRGWHSTRCGETPLRER